MIIAVDGALASGKGTIARTLASTFSLPYLDTGSLYRATALAVLDAGDDPADTDAAIRAARGLKVDAIDETRIRTAERFRSNTLWTSCANTLPRLASSSSA